MPLKNYVFGLLLFSLIPIANADEPICENGYPARPPTFVSMNGLNTGAACTAGVVQGNETCFKTTATVELKGASNSAAAAAPASGPKNASAAGSVAGINGIIVGNFGQDACTLAVKICMKGCYKTQSELAKYVSDCNTIENFRTVNTVACNGAEKDLAEAKRATSECKINFTKKGTNYMCLAGMSAQKIAEYTKVNLAATGKTVGDVAEDVVGTTGDFLENNWGKLAVGGLGVAAVVAISKKGDKGGDGGSGSSTITGGVGGGVPDCTKDDAAKNLLCDGQLLIECSALNKVTSAKCSAFTDRHCGFSAATDKINSAPGLGSELCKDAMAGKYCKNEAKAKCYSCLTLKDRQANRCLANPASCRHQNTVQEMGYYKHTCSDDPVFTDLKWASVVATLLPAGATLPPTVPVGQPTMPVGQPPTSIDQASQSRIPAKASGVMLASDTSPKFGQSVFSRSSQTLKSLCNQGNLNNCGTRKSVGY